MENKESGNLNNNGTDHKLDVDEVIAAEAATTEEFNAMIAKASESVAETASVSNLGNEQPVEDDMESIDEGEKIIRLLKENDSYLPYYDKSDPDEIYSFFSMSNVSSLKSLFCDNVSSSTSEVILSFLVAGAESSSAPTTLVMYSLLSKYFLKSSITGTY